MKKLIISFCGGSGAWEKPYTDRPDEYEVLNVTLPAHDVRTFDIRPYFNKNLHGILAAPPCNEYSFVKSEKLERDWEGADEVLGACLRAISLADLVCPTLKWWALENPIGHIISRIGPPKFIFQPWEFGDPWTKRTGIWGNFTPPVKTFSRWADVPQNASLYIRPGRKKPNMVWLHKSAQKDIPAFSTFAPAANDAAFRAMTPQGFAKAFYEVNR